jgi:hypothetical protein
LRFVDPGELSSRQLGVVLSLADEHKGHEQAGLGHGENVPRGYGAHSSPPFDQFYHRQLSTNGFSTPITSLQAAAKCWLIVIPNP